jgi:hypothetical protein
VKKFAFLLGVFLLMSPAGPLLADNHNGEDNSIPENLPVPAIIVEEPPEQIEDVAWTYRFLIPTTVAIATLVILGNIIQYFRQVTRKRYKVIEK